MTRSNERSECPPALCGTSLIAKDTRELRAPSVAPSPPHSLYLALANRPFQCGREKTLVLDGGAGTGGVVGHGPGPRALIGGLGDRLVSSLRRQGGDRPENPSAGPGRGDARGSD